MPSLTTSCRRPVPTSRTTLPRPSIPTTATSSARAAAVRGARVGQRRDRSRRRSRAAPLPPRDQHDAQLGRFVLVLPALPRPGQPRGVRRPRERALLARAPRPTRRRRSPGTVDPGGCRSSTSAGSSTLCCTCSMRVSGTRCCTTLGYVSSDGAVPAVLSHQGMTSQGVGLHATAAGKYVPGGTQVEERPGGPGEVPIFTWHGRDGRDRELRQDRRRAAHERPSSPDEMGERVRRGRVARVRAVRWGRSKLSKPSGRSARSCKAARRFLERRVASTSIDTETETGAVRRFRPTRLPDNKASDERALHADDRRRSRGRLTEALRFNTAIAKLIESSSTRRRRQPTMPRRVVRGGDGADGGAGARRTSPRRCGQRLGSTTAAWHTRPSPLSDPAKIVQGQVTCVIQIRGKVRDRMEVFSRHHRGRPARAGSVA